MPLRPNVKQTLVKNFTHLFCYNKTLGRQHNFFFYVFLTVHHDINLF
jgi:hypothetical protein